MANFSFEGVKTSAKKLFSKSKARTEEVLQITQLNQRLRAVRNEREEGIKKLGEEAYAKWLSQEFTSNTLDELCEYIQEKEKQIEEIEQEKLTVRENSAQKIREADSLTNEVKADKDLEAPIEVAEVVPEDLRGENSEQEEAQTIVISEPVTEKEVIKDPFLEDEAKE